jgi:hypothetical protein
MQAVIVMKNLPTSAPKSRSRNKGTPLGPQSLRLQEGISHLGPVPELSFSTAGLRAVEAMLRLSLVRAPDESAIATEILEKAYALVGDGRKDEAADHIYDRFHDLLSKADFGSCDHVLRLADPIRLGSSLLRSLLVLTLKAKANIPSRDRFYQFAYSHIMATQDESRAKRLLEHLG